MWGFDLSHARLILAFQHHTVQHIIKRQRFPDSHFKCCSLSQVNR